VIGICDGDVDPCAVGGRAPLDTTPGPPGPDLGAPDVVWWRLLAIYTISAAMAGRLWSTSTSAVRELSTQGEGGYEK
jgi:hypothetical protein